MITHDEIKYFREKIFSGSLQDQICLQLTIIKMAETETQSSIWSALGEAAYSGPLKKHEL